MKRLTSILLLFFVLTQMTFALQMSYVSEKTKSEITQFTLLDEGSEILLGDLRIQKPNSKISSEYRNTIDDCLSQFKKGNSLFYIHNQLLPKTLSLNKILASFFTSYFSTAV